jgi:hypothetical protein
MGIADEIRARRHGVRLSAQRLFANRNAEKEAFEAKLSEVRSLRGREPDWAADLRLPRRNVLVYYGHGGIGKSRLSRELEQLLLDSARQARRRAGVVRVDFSEPAARDPELYLFALRAGMSALARSFPAFDTALSVYWSRQHPAMSMPEFIRNQSVLGGATDREALASNFKDWFQDLVDGAGLIVGGTSRVVNLTWSKLREKQTVKRLLRECAFFESCITEDDLDELRLHLPLLLAWDLSQLRRAAETDAVVFLDTFEHVTDGHRTSRLGDLEDVVARSAFFLRGVVFVVTSRSQLDWSDERRSATLEFAGPDDWPGLADIADDEGDQHFVGVLSPDDCEDYLAGCLLDSDERPAIEPTLRAGIAGMSSGVPLYLDIAVNHYIGLVAHGRTPTVNDFARGIPEIVMRLMEDLDESESDLLRAAALLGVFDRATLHVAVPQVRASAIETFLARSFVVDRGDQIYSVHELLQTSVRTQDAATTNAWSPEEWRAAQQRLVDHWSAQFQDRAAALWRDRRSQALAFWQLAGLYATTDVAAEVLADVVMQVQLRGVWATIDAGRSQPEELLTDRGRGLLLALDGIMARQVGRLDEGDRLLSEALAVPAFTGNMARLTKYYLAETRDIHEGDPTPLFLGLAEVDDRIGTEARMAHAHSLTRAGDLAGALAIAEQFPPDTDDPEFRYRLHELLGVIWLFAGKFSQAAEHFEITSQVAESEGSILFEALAQRHLALALCWTEPASVLDRIDDAERLNRDLNLYPGIGQCLLARAVALAGTAPLDEVDALLAEADTTFNEAGYYDDALGAPAISVFAAVVAGEEDLAQQRRATFLERAQGRRPRTWRALVDVWTNHKDYVDEVTWPQGQLRAVGDWTSPIQGRPRRSPGVDSRNR